jgi:hypothetical protein
MTVSIDGKFRTTQLSDHVWITEALGQDWFDWGNYDVENPHKFPAFLAYFGCNSRQEAKENVTTMSRLYGVDCEVRKGKRTGWPIEIKIRGLYRESDTIANGGLSNLIGMGEVLSQKPQLIAA